MSEPAPLYFLRRRARAHVRAVRVDAAGGELGRRIGADLERWKTALAAAPRKAWSERRHWPTSRRRARRESRSTGILPAGSMLANSRFAPALEVIPWRGDARRRGVRQSECRCGELARRGRVARSGSTQRRQRRGDRPDASLDELASRGRTRRRHRRLVARRGVGFHPPPADDQLADDINRLREHRFLERRIDNTGRCRRTPRCSATIRSIVHGRRRAKSGSSRRSIEPHVVLDATAGRSTSGAGSTCTRSRASTGPATSAAR